VSCALYEGMQCIRFELNASSGSDFLRKSSWGSDSFAGLLWVYLIMFMAF